MTTKAISDIQAALEILNAVTNELIHGVNEEHLIQKYDGYFVVPGVRIKQHLRELRQGGCLREDNGLIYLRDECNPILLMQTEQT